MAAKKETEGLNAAEDASARRDLFAAAALVGLVTAFKGEQDAPAKVAHYAWKLAGAMVALRP